MKEQNLATIPWPAAFPALSPTENIGGLMKIEVLIRSVLQARATITKKSSSDLVSAVPQHLVKRLELNGGCSSK